MAASGFIDPGTGIFIQTAPNDRIRDPNDPLVNLSYHRHFAARQLRTARREGWAHLAPSGAYIDIVKRATRPVLAQHRMIESAIRMTVQMDSALAVWRKVA